MKTGIDACKVFKSAVIDLGLLICGEFEQTTFCKWWLRIMR